MCSNYRPVTSSQRLLTFFGVEAGPERRAGDVFFLYLLWYGAGRTIIEGLRTDSLMLGPIRVSQLLSLALCLCGLAHFWRGKRCLLQERK